jgi:CheY-like chemotaxis protein
MPALANLDTTHTGAPGHPRGLSLLLVEDDEADAYLIGRALTDNPAIGKVTHARDGVEALRMVERGEVEPDLAFIDLHMPLMDGFALLVAFTNSYSVTFPMVVLTSSSSPSDAIRSRLRNAVRVITKPDSVAEMQALLKAVIRDVCLPRDRGSGLDASRQKRDLLTNSVWESAAAGDGATPPSVRAQVASEVGEFARKTASLTAAAHLARIGDWDFLATMGHELRAPLGSILGMVQIMNRGDLSAAQRQNLDTLQISGRALLDNLLDLSGLQAGAMEIKDRLLMPKCSPTTPYAIARRTQTPCRAGCACWPPRTTPRTNWS